LRRGFIFFSDDSGAVFRLPLDGSLSPTSIIDKSKLGFDPTVLSVDWLNDVLYIVGEAGRAKWRIMKCSLDGQNLSVALAGVHNEPRQLQIDPYNGYFEYFFTNGVRGIQVLIAFSYMFWIMKNTRNNDGLYRLDLAEPSNGVRHEILPELIIDNSTIGAFTIDYSGFRLLIADEMQNTVLDVKLDG
jgi:proto-oncogene tyrosine-protein kinase ROS